MLTKRSSARTDDGHLPEAVVVTYNSAAHIRPCLASLQVNVTRTVVVDNGSHDETINIISREFPEVKLISAGKNLGYGPALNLGITETISPYVLAANADTIFPERSLQRLTDFLDRNPGAALVGPQQIFPDGAWQRSFGELPSLWQSLKMVTGITTLASAVERMSWTYRATRFPKRVGYVDGAVMMIRRAAFDAVQGFDESFHYYAEDIDICLRLKEVGWEVFNVPGVTVIHVRGGSSTRVEGRSERLLELQLKADTQLMKKHRSTWTIKPYIWMCRLHAYKMMLMYRMLAVCSADFSSSQADSLAKAFEREGRLWKDLTTHC